MVSESELQDTKAPELYGWPLVLAAHALSYLGFVKKKVAKDAGLFRLRDQNLEDHPTTLAIPSNYFYSPGQSATIEENTKLDIEHKSISPYLSSWDYHEAYTSLKLTPTQIAKSLLETIEKHNDNMHWIRFFDKDIMNQAEESTERYKNGKPLGLLDGVFVSVKEELNIKGLENKMGSCFIDDGKPAEYDSTVVARLREAGAIVIGSSIMNELGWDTFTVNPNTGTPKNPFNPTHSCGGSSGGSSGIVSAGVIPISIGSDGGGSVRIPSSFCGLYGLKTTFSRVSGHGGATVDPTVGAYGPIAATADDMALAYSIIAGPDPNDVNSMLQPPPSLKDYNKYQDLSDLTIGIFPNWNKRTDEPAILNSLNDMKEQLGKLGARFVELELEDLNLIKIAHSITICSEMYSYASRYQDNYGKYLAHTRLMIETASLLEGKDYIRAQQIRTRAMNQLRDIFENKKVDLLLTPTTALVAPEIPEGALAYGISNVNNTNRAMEYCSIANLTGVPAVSVPFGYHQGNLPIGLQFIGAWWNEALLLRIAKACERIPGNHRKRPDDHWYSVDVIKK